METGEGGELFRKHHVSGEVIRRQLELQGWQRGRAAAATARRRCSATRTTG